MIGMDHDHTVNENGRLHRYSRETLMTDVYREKSLDFLRRATDDASDPPFMLWVGTFAPHLPADYADRHADLYRGARLPKPPSFNEENLSDKPEWIRKIPSLTSGEIRTLQEEH